MVKSSVSLHPFSATGLRTVLTGRASSEDPESRVHLRGDTSAATSVPLQRTGGSPAEGKWPAGGSGSRGREAGESV